MKKSKKALSLALALVLSMSMMAGCGNSASNSGSQGETAETPKTEDAAPAADTSNEDAAPAADAECTLTVVTMMGGTDPNTEKFHAVIDEFKTTHPNVTIEDNSAVADNDWKVQVEADFAMDNEPDVIQYFTDATATNILQTNKMVPLADMQAANPEIAKNTSAVALEQTKSPIDGVNYAVPTTGYWEGLFCNKDLFEQYNVALPTDWNSLLEAVKVFKENGITPIAVSLNTVPHYWIEFLMLTASTVDEFVTVPTDVPQSWVDGYAKFKELYDAGAFPVDVATIDNDMAGNQFKEKKAAMQLDGSWYLNGIPDQDNTVVIAFPKWDGAKSPEGAAIQGYSSGFYITKKAWDDPAKRQAALDFVLANTNDAQVMKYWGGNGACSVPVPEGGDFTPLQVSGAAYAATITNPVGPTDSRISTEAYGALISNALPVATGKMTAEDAIKAMLEINNR